MKKENLNELIRYIITGVCTTLVNYIIFVLCLYINKDMYLTANTIAWIGAVLFAYYTNKKYVFKSDGNSKQEFQSFLILRLLTLLIENVLLYVLIQLLMPVLIAKITVSFITIMSNYILCKCKIFKKEGE